MATTTKKEATKKATIPEITEEITLFRQSTIENIVKHNPHPDQDLCPLICIHWEGKTKEGSYTKYYLNKTGEILDHWNQRQYEGKRVIHRSTGKACDAIYMKHHTVEEYGTDVLEIAGISIELNRGKENQPRDWDYCKLSNKSNWYLDRLFLFKNDVRVYNERGYEVHPEMMGKYYNTLVLKTFEQDYARLERNDFADTQAISFVGREAIKPFLYTAWDGSGLYLGMYRFSNWYQKSLPRTKSKTADTIEEISKLITTGYNSYCVAHPLKLIPGDPHGENYYDRYDSYENTTMAILEEHQGWGVFRRIQREENDTNRRENLRIFIAPNGKTTIMESYNNNWTIVSKRINSYFYYTGKGLKFYGLENMENITHLKYLKSILPTPENFQISTLCDIVNMLRHPIVELLCKAGYNNIAKDVIARGEIAANLSGMFAVKEHKGSLTEILKLNKYQLKKIDALIANENNYNSRGYHYYNSSTLGRGLITAIKEITGMDNLSSLSNQSTDEYFERVDCMLKNTSYWRSQFVYTFTPEDGMVRKYWQWRTRGVDPLNDDDRKNIKRLMKVCNGNPENFTMAADTLRMLANLPNDIRPRLNAYEVSNMRELMELHDDIVRLDLLWQERRRAEYDRAESERLKLRDEKLKKLAEKRKELYEYEDEKYKFIVPESCEALIQEGVIQSICIGGYTERYANGQCELVFMREQGREDIPFYAIEIIKGSGSIVQIRGHHNCGSGCHPEIISSIIKWLKAKKLKCEAGILLNGCNHYGMGDYIDGTPYGITSTNQVIS